MDAKKGKRKLKGWEIFLIVFSIIIVIIAIIFILIYVVFKEEISSTQESSTIPIPKIIYKEKFISETVDVELNNFLIGIPNQNLFINNEGTKVIFGNPYYKNPDPPNIMGRIEIYEFMNGFWKLSSSIKNNSASNISFGYCITATDDLKIIFIGNLNIDNIIYIALKNQENNEYILVNQNTNTVTSYNTLVCTNNLTVNSLLTGNRSNSNDIKIFSVSNSNPYLSFTKSLIANSRYISGVGLDVNILLSGFEVINNIFNIKTFRKNNQNSWETNNNIITGFSLVDTFSTNRIFSNNKNFVLFTGLPTLNDNPGEGVAKIVNIETQGINSQIIFKRGFIPNNIIRSTPLFFSSSAINNDGSAFIIGTLTPDLFIGSYDINQNKIAITDIISTNNPMNGLAVNMSNDANVVVSSFYNSQTKKYGFQIFRKELQTEEDFQIEEF